MVRRYCGLQGSDKRRFLSRESMVGGRAPYCISMTCGSSPENYRRGFDKRTLGLLFGRISDDLINRCQCGVKISRRALWMRFSHG